MAPSAKISFIVLMGWESTPLMVFSQLKVLEQEVPPSAPFRQFFLPLSGDCAAGMANSFFARYDSGNFHDNSVEIRMPVPSSAPHHSRSCPH